VKQHQPKIAFFDIETAPSLGYFWGKLYETNIVKVDTPWYMLCFSYRWLGDRAIHTRALRDYPSYKSGSEDDRRLVRDLRNMLDEADIVIAHNGDRFDLKAANTRFIYHGLKPPSLYRSIDTLKIARSQFCFDSNRLDALGRFLDVGGKRVHTGFDLWSRTMQGDPEAWSQMEKYNRRDVELLEKVYYKLRAYAKVHPNMAAYNNGEGCPRCQSLSVRKIGVLTQVKGLYQRRHCNSCGYSFTAERVKA
jgi:DNA polymerase elongation subunit (family B)